MQSKWIGSVTLAATFVLAAIVPAGAQDAGVELGLLDCTVAGGAGMIFGSTKDVSCIYTPTDTRFAPETYVGAIRKWGVDIGFTDEAVMKWAVLASSADIYAPGSLAGDYSGASAEATVTVGAGANLLVGGTSNGFSLQPLSVQGQTGFNLAAGITSLNLHLAN